MTIAVATWSLLRAAAIASIGCFLAGRTAAGDDGADFYKGRQISLILSAGEGGGYSSYAKVFAPYLATHIPGRPSIIIQSMPGAGGLRAMVHLAANAARDGTVLGLVHSGLPLAPLLGINGSAFDARQMRWIGSLNSSLALCVAWADAGFNSASDLKQRQFVVGGTGAGSQMETYPVMLERLLGFKVKVVSGYKSGNEVYLAMERGEVHGRCGGGLASLNATRPDWLPQHKVTIPIVFGLERSPALPDVVSVGELAPSDRARRILQLILTPQQIDRPLLAPPGVPEKRIAQLRGAFHAAFNDPRFQAEARRINLEIEEVAGTRVEAIIAEAYAMPADIVSGAKSVLGMTGKE